MLWVVTGVRTYIGVAIAVASCSCGAAKGSHSRATPDQPADFTKDEIQGRWREIREWQRELGLESAWVVKGPICFQASPQTRLCKEVCNLTAHICDNEKSICAHATELGNDSWADRKCTESREVCRTARQRCCVCGNPRGGGTGIF